MAQQRAGGTIEKRNWHITGWKKLAALLGPSLLLLPILVLYLSFKGTPHFFLHTLMGWDLALILLLVMRYAGRHPSRWDGVLPLALALYAMTPDFIYSFNPFHRDWMDVFLFHVALDEILPFALIILALLWIVLLVGYVQLPARIPHPRNAPEEEVHGPSPGHAGAPLSVRQLRQPGFLLVASVITLTVLAASGVVTERSAHTSLIQVGQRASNFALPSTSGSTASLAIVRGRPVLLAFVPSVLCDFCREQLRTIQAILPELRARGMVAFAVSTDTTAVQSAAVTHLGLDYPLLSEAPTVGQHQVGSAYGVYHVSQGDAAPVDANAIVVIDAMGIVRAVRLEPDRSISETEILTLLNTVHPFSLFEKREAGAITSDRSEHCPSRRALIWT